MKTYNKNEWKDRIVEYPNRYKDQNDNLLTLTPEPGEISQVGTLVEAKKMNNIEDGIENNDTSLTKLIGADTWSADKKYSAYDKAIYERKIYINKTGVNTSTTPDKDSINWEEISLLDEDKQFNKKLYAYPNAGFHNSIYRGKDITDLFYNGILTKEIANGTFDDIFIGDYIIGKSSGRKYLVADINYRLGKGWKDNVSGNGECKTPHVLMIPDKIMGTAQMNTSNVTTGAYIGSAMYNTNLETYRTIIKNDFGDNHILSHRNVFAKTVTNGYESAGDWYDSTIDLMNEMMVYGSNVFHNITNGTNTPYNYEIDNSQLALFRLDKSHIIARNDNNERCWWWLRNVANASCFCSVGGNGYGDCNSASYSNGVRPCFLIY